MSDYVVAAYDSDGHAHIVHVRGTETDAYVRANTLALAYGYATISQNSRILDTVVASNTFAA